MIRYIIKWSNKWTGRKGTYSATHGRRVDAWDERQKLNDKHPDRAHRVEARIGGNDGR